MVGAIRSEKVYFHGQPKEVGLPQIALCLDGEM